MTPSEIPRKLADRPRYKPRTPSLRRMSSVIPIAGPKAEGRDGLAAEARFAVPVRAAAELAIGRGKGDSERLGVELTVGPAEGRLRADNCKRVFTTILIRQGSPSWILMSNHPILGLCP